MLDNELELDFSDIDGSAGQGTGDDSGLEFDYSDVEGASEPEDNKTDGKESESNEDESNEDESKEGESKEGESNDDESKEGESAEEEANENESAEEEANEDESEEGENESSNKPEDENNESEGEGDDTLSEIDRLLGELDDNSEKSEENLEKADEIVNQLGDEGNAGEASNLIEQLKIDNSQYKTTVDQLNKLITKLNKEKGDIMMRNTELELYGNIDEPNLVYLNGNLEKAKGGDEKSKARIIGILDDLRTELAGSTMEEDSVDEKTDLISKVSSLNSSSNPNIKASGGVDDFEINL